MADWVKQTGVDPQAVSLLLGTMPATPPDALRQVTVPALVVAGEQDSRSASAAELTALLPNGRLALVPGDHLTALDAPEFTAAVLDFLG
jgi:pimeloyl-ACP methyl ester carboxylesterase